MAGDLTKAILGRTGLEVTRLGYGALEVQDVGPGAPITEDQAGAVLNATLDAGINFIDTAPCYGRSEDMIGKYISNRRSEFYLATKSGCHPELKNVWTRENMFMTLHQSLRRLNTDYIDVVQLHNPKTFETEWGGLVDALLEMKEQGKVRWIGVSTNLPSLADYVEWGVFDVFQMNYSTLQREHEDWITSMAASGIGTMIRTRAAKGEPDIAGSLAHAEGRSLSPEERWDRWAELKMDELVEEGESRTQFVQRYTLAHPDVHTIILGTKDLDHLAENVETFKKGPLPADVVEETNRRLDSVGLTASPVTVGAA